MIPRFQIASIAIGLILTTSCKSDEVGIGGSNYELSGRASWSESYFTGGGEGFEDDPRDKDDQTLELGVQASRFISRNLSMGLTVQYEDFKDSDGENGGDVTSLAFLFSPRYYMTISEGDALAFYAGPDLGIAQREVNQGPGPDAENFDRSEFAWGAVAGAKLFAWDSFAVFGEFYMLTDEGSDSDGFEFENEDRGLRFGLSVFF